MPGKSGNHASPWKEVLILPPELTKLHGRGKTRDTELGTLTAYWSEQHEIVAVQVIYEPARVTCPVLVADASEHRDECSVCDGREWIEGAPRFPAIEELRDAAEEFEPGPCMWTLQLATPAPELQPGSASLMMVLLARGKPEGIVLT